MFSRDDFQCLSLYNRNIKNLLSYKYYIKKYMLRDQTKNEKKRKKRKPEKKNFMLKKMNILLSLTENFPTLFYYISN